MSETILDTIPVKDKSDLSRDVHSNAIINTNRNAYEMAVKRSKDAKKQRDEMFPRILKREDGYIPVNDGKESGEKIHMNDAMSQIHNRNQDDRLHKYDHETHKDSAKTVAQEHRKESEKNRYYESYE